MVIDTDSDKRRISLGLKQCFDNPWTAFVDTFPVDTIVEGEIKNITEFGLFIGLDDDIDGMAHLSDLSWEKAGEEALADYKKGDIVKAKVLDVDIEKERISLGIKQLTKDTVANAMSDVKKGVVVTCTITAILDNGIEVQVNESIPGFIRKSELSRDRSEQRPDRFAPGEKIDAKVTQLDKSGRRVTLSIKAREAEEEKKAMAEYGSTDAGASLGDILGAAFAEKAAEVEKKIETGTATDEGKPKPRKKAVKKAGAVDKPSADETIEGDTEKKPTKKKAKAKAKPSTKDTSEAAASEAPGVTSDD
jgi:small subunit ribosomal protein S1